MFKTLILSIFAIKSPSTNNLPHFWPKVQILFPPSPPRDFLEEYIPMYRPVQSFETEYLDTNYSAFRSLFGLIFGLRNHLRETQVFDLIEI